MSFQPIFGNFATRPTTTTLKSPLVPLHALIRDQLTVTTWLLLGALIQCLTSAFLPYRNIVLVLPILLILTYKLTTTLLTIFGILENPHMKGVIPYRTSVVLPNEKGIMPDNPSENPVCAIVLAVVSNHPLGMFAEGFKEIGDRFDGMVKEMSADATKHGFLGSSSWINAGDRTTSNEYMTILYFENEHALHEYAHGPMHTATTQWWRETEKRLRHIGIMHEVFACPKNSWEAIYLNYKPVGLGATTKEVTSESGQKEWVNPLVKIKGKLHYSKGRMGRTVGAKEWDTLSTKFSD